MNRNNDVLLPYRWKRRRLAPLAGLLGLALTAGACSTNNPASDATATTDPPVTGLPSEGTTPTTEINDDVEALFDELEAADFNGVVSLRTGHQVTTRSFGTADRENDVAIDDETVFDIGSVTKQFTAAAILHLETEGRLSVDDTLGQHVPDLPADTAAITLHQLLTHTAGLPHGFGPDDEPLTRSDFLARVAETPLVDAPGERFEYSNIGYSLLTAVIEFETGEPYESYLRSALFEPAGMLDTGYVLPDWDGHTIAVGYDHRTGDRFGRPNEQPWDANGPYWNLFGNGGILSTAADMLRWDVALAGDDILDAAAKAKLFAPHVSVSPEVHYGYGWLIVATPSGAPIITHNGGNGVFYADLMRFTDQDAAVYVATNSHQDDVGSITDELANRALGGLPSAITDGESATNCGFDELSIGWLPNHPELTALPDSPPGRTTARLLDLLNEDDSAARLDFATNHVSTELGGDDPAVIADTVVELKELLAGYEVVRILGESDERMHLFMQGPGPDLLLSVGFDEVDSERLVCLNLSD
jgi:CubicO group peptidase (beta-lactamase class C family)